MVLPLFPLPLVVYPGEKLSLHIFEERYQELIKDCEKEAITFGVPAFINKNMEYGTEVVLKKVVKRYENGFSDVVCIGKKVFKIKNFIHQMPNKLYAGGVVEFLESDATSSFDQGEKMLSRITSLYEALEIENPPTFGFDATSFNVAHKIGLSLEQECYLLTLDSEEKRVRYIIAHLDMTIPIIREMNRTRQVIALNGHFKNFDPLDFKEIDTL